MARRGDGTPGRQVHAAMYRAWVARAVDRIVAGAARDLLLIEVFDDRVTKRRLDAAADKLFQAVEVLWCAEPPADTIEPTNACGTMKDTASGRSVRSGDGSAGV